MVLVDECLFHVTMARFQLTERLFHHLRWGQDYPFEAICSLAETYRDENGQSTQAVTMWRSV